MAGLLLLWVLALSWVAVGSALIARTVEGANGFTFLVLFLPYLCSAFVPVETMTAGLRAVAANQPVTPIIETLRGLLPGTPIGSHGWQAVLWCGALLMGRTRRQRAVPPPFRRLDRPGSVEVRPFRTSSVRMPIYLAATGTARRVRMSEHTGDLRGAESTTPT